MIDTHCHLTFKEFRSRVGDVLADARSHGVEGCITISTTTTDCLDALAIARAHPNVWCTAGVHPCYADREPHVWENLRVCMSDGKCVAWGELGLDNHHAEPGRVVQHGVLGEQLAFIEKCACEGVSRPIVLHCREAFAELVPILRGTKLDPSRMVFHCFTGSVADVRLALDMGAWISFTGVVTYRSAIEVKEAARLVPHDRIMVETDAPFLSPEPKRGVRPCEPWMVSLTAKALAGIRGVEWPAFHEQINENTRRFFGVPCAGVTA